MPELLIIDNNPPEERDRVVDAGGRGDVDCYREVIDQCLASAEITVCSSVQDGDRLLSLDLGRFDGIIWSGSALSVNANDPPVLAARAVLERAMSVKVPCFGSCWGLQLASTLFGGKVKKARNGPQVKLEKDIWLTNDGHGHRMFAGKAPRFQAVQVHQEEITRLPDTGRLLASSKDTEVEAAEIVIGEWRFWGTQYHPEFTLRDLGPQIAVDGDKLVRGGAYPSKERLETVVSRFQNAPEDELRRAEQVSSTVLDTRQRSLEIRNWLCSLGASDASHPPKCTA
jgi:GMP synthase (glutamine-hydrolysing)